MALRVPQRGTLDDLENRHRAFLNRVSGDGFAPVPPLAAYGIASYIVDGNDAVAMYSTAKEAVERARAGEGPILIEAKTFRRRGHAQHDPADYVPAEQREYWEKRDPITLYEKFLTAGKILDAKGKKDRARDEHRPGTGQGNGCPRNHFRRGRP